MHLWLIQTYASRKITTKNFKQSFIKENTFWGLITKQKPQKRRGIFLFSSYTSNSYSKQKCCKPKHEHSRELVMPTNIDLIKIDTFNLKATYLLSFQQKEKQEFYTL